MFWLLNEKLKKMLLNMKKTKTCDMKKHAKTHVFFSKNFQQAKNMLHQQKHDLKKNIFEKTCFLTLKSMIKNPKR